MGYFAQLDLQCLHVASRGGVWFSNNFWGVCACLSCNEDQTVTVTQNTDVKMMWIRLVLSTRAAWFVKHYYQIISFAKREREGNSQRVRGSDGAVRSTGDFFLSSLLEELSTAAGAESLRSVPLTDLTKQLRDISVFTEVTRNIL